MHRTSPLFCGCFDSRNLFCSELLVIDARPYTNAAANKGRRGGFEDVGRYTRRCADGSGKAAAAWTTRLHFMDIDNIHAMRGSLSALTKLFYDAGGGGKAAAVAPAGLELEELLDGGCTAVRAANIGWHSI